MKYELEIEGSVRRVEIVGPDVATNGPICAHVDGREIDADIAQIAPDIFSVLVRGRPIEVRLEPSASGLVVHAGDRQFHVRIADPREWRRGRAGAAELEGRQQVTAPMPGKIVSVLVAAGETVHAGQGLLVVEAMKMQNEIVAPKSGTLEKVLVREGQTVNAGELLAVIA
jgi:biotin carboxyl carrier protein